MHQLNIDLQPTLAQARATGQRAQQLATDRAERETPNFSERVQAAVLAKLATGPASGEDLTDHVAACGIPFADGRALGGIYRAMKNAGLIEVCGTCLRRYGHSAAGGRVWRLKP